MGLLNEEHYNNKWPKAPIIYSGRALRGKKDRINVDVKNFISTNDEILNEIVKRYKLQKSNPDDTAWEVQKWVVKFLTYKYDDDLNQTPEFWQFPFETLQSQHGDCEDGAILITSLCVAAGVPTWRTKVAAGYVQASPTAPRGGHAWSIYLASNGEWYNMDWCYYEDSSIPVLKKPLAKDGGQKNAYGEIWFTFNSEYSWNQTSIEIKGRISNDKTETSSKDSNNIISSKLITETILEKIDKHYQSKNS